MNPTEYLKQSGVTESVVTEVSAEDIKTLHAILGLQTEVGELADYYKKGIFYGKMFDINDVALEIGDILWYLAIIIRQNGWSFESLMAANIAKLRARYGEQFNAYDAQVRDEEAEMENALSHLCGEDDEERQG